MERNEESLAFRLTDPEGPSPVNQDGLTAGQIENEERKRQKTSFRRYRTYNYVTTSLLIAAALWLLIDQHGFVVYFLVVFPALFFADWIGAKIFRQEYRPWPLKAGSRDRGF